MLGDLRYACRTLLKSPGFTLTAILALALGIGSNTAIFSAVNSVLYHPPGVSQPERVVAVRIKYDKLNMKSIGNSVIDFKDVRDQTGVFSAAATGNVRSFNYATPGAPVRLLGAAVSYQWFDVFGARPMLGRSFNAEEDLPEANYEVILSHGTWERNFGKDPHTVGRSIELNQHAYKIIGVMPPDFTIPAQADFWTPLAIKPASFSPDNRHNQNLNMFARLRPDIPFERGQSTATMLTRRVLETEDTQGFAKSSGWGMFLVPYLEYSTGDLRKPMWILLGAVGFVLLIACSNIAGLLLARASGRMREIAVRAALGARRSDLLRQLLAESGMLAFTGGALGLLLGFGGIRLLLLIVPLQVMQGTAITMDPRVLLFALAVTALSGLLFGLAPAWQLSRPDQYEALREGGRSGTAGKARQRMRSALVTAEVAIALVLLVGAGLFIRSLARLQGVDTGFQPAAVVSGFVSPPAAAYKEEAKLAAFYRSVVEHLQSSPGVTGAAAIMPLPFSGDDWGASFSIEGRQQLPGDPGPHGSIRYVSPNYFAVMGIPMRAGRAFTEAEAGKTDPVAIIDEKLAAQYWPNENPIGKHLRNGRSQPWATIVGVAAAIRHNELATESNKGVYYFPTWQSPAPLTAFVVKGPQGGAAIRAAVQSVDPAQPVYDLKTMDERIASSLGPRRFAVRLLGGFAVIALLMAAIGLYGMISYAVAQRTQEIGIRMALGAQRSEVLKLILGHGMRLALTGVAIGLVASALLTRIVVSQLYQVSRFDPLTFAATSLALVAVAALASYLPARRAMKVDPMIALRYE